MFELLFLDKFDIYLYSMLEDVFVVLMLYSFIKLVLLSSLFELIWPTQFFNRRHTSGLNSYRLRTFSETLLKLRLSNLSIPQILIFLNIR